MDEGWLERILTECYSKDKPTEVKVTSFEVAKGSESSESVLSDILAVSVEAEVDNTKKYFDFIIKLLPVDPFSRYFVTEAEFDLREIKFYTKVVPDLEEFQELNLRNTSLSIVLPLPKCYLGKYVPFEFLEQPPSPTNQINESIIILKNLKKDGYYSVDFTKGLTFQQAQSAFEAISRLHALSLVMKVREKKPLLVKYEFLFKTKKASSSYQQLMERGLPQLTHFLENFPEMKTVVDCLNLIRPKMKYLIEVLLFAKEPISLITHMDFWSNNLLFKEDQCAILDWQMVTSSQPTNDLALLIISSLSPKIRRDHTNNLLDYYWNKFTENTKKLGLDVEADLEYGRHDLAKDYRNSQLLALLLCIGSIDVALNNRDIEERLKAVLLDLHKDGILCQDFLESL